MWELVVPMSKTTGLKIDTKWCANDVQEVAQDIVSNNSNGYVAVSWEHTVIPELVGWLMAYGGNIKASGPVTKGIPQKWQGDVFDQYWIIDFRGKSAAFSIQPESILPGDCPTARSSNGKCPGTKEGFTAMLRHESHHPEWCWWAKVGWLVLFIVMLCMLYRDWVKS